MKRIRNDITIQTGNAIPRFLVFFLLQAIVDTKTILFLIPQISLCLTVRLVRRISKQMHPKLERINLITANALLRPSTILYGPEG